MNYKDDFNVFVGGQSGVFKGIKVKEKSCLTKNIQNLVSITDHHQVTFMTWSDNDEKEILLACGSKDTRSVKTFDTEYHSFKTSFVCDIGKGPITGIAKCNNHILTAVQSGQIKLWTHNDNLGEQLLLEAGEGLCRMRQARKEKTVIATGGLENPLKLFNLEKKANTFTAKNVRHDWLEMRVPVSISDLCFMSDDRQVLTVGKYGHIRLYDTNAQRRPVLDVEMKDEAVTSVTSCFHDFQVVCGTGKGKMNLVDLRKTGKILNSYKGPVGAVTALAVSKSEPYVVSVSYDRHLYVHDLSTKKLLKKVYLTSKLSGMVLRSEFSMKEVEKEEDNEIEMCEVKSDSESEDSDIEFSD
ncbi:WD repeat-containing protein 74 [Copidosoma floridanum]|uniref:WD repeat-containing protein 74 n=1 Tax=Copidosoma floridanum TaxID=29053 RepID=UPI0006C98F80|nr:WD repeat-containing protein 74 [Copidosoma floridanum]